MEAPHPKQRKKWTGGTEKSRFVVDVMKLTQCRKKTGGGASEKEEADKRR